MHNSKEHSSEQSDEREGLASTMILYEILIYIYIYMADRERRSRYSVCCTAVTIHTMGGTESAT